MIKVLIVDDHKIVREGLRAIIDSTFNMKVAGECHDGSEVANAIKENPVDIILMDVVMPQQDGISTTMQIHESYPDIKIIALSMQSDYYTIHKMLTAGASGYTIKSAGGPEILKAIQRVYDGNSYFSKEVTSSVMMSMMDKSEETTTKPKVVSEEIVQRLTKREIEILKHIANEETNEDIGIALNISAGTVATHRRNLLQKLEVRNSIGLAKIAYQSGIV